jgi:hypothetical protein
VKMPLFVCHANCCRSVLAYYLYRHLCGAAALSAAMEVGDCINDRALAMLDRWGIDASSFPRKPTNGAVTCRGCGWLFRSVCLGGFLAAGLPDLRSARRGWMASLTLRASIPSLALRVGVEHQFLVLFLPLARSLVVFSSCCWRSARAFSSAWMASICSRALGSLMVAGSGACSRPG